MWYRPAVSHGTRHDRGRQIRRLGWRELLTAGIEWLTASIKLKQAKAEADRLGLIEKINAAIEPPK